jgi:iron complex transport system ATP-binding protein
MQAPLSGEVSLDGGPLGDLDALERARRLAVVLTDRIDSGMMTGADLVALGRYPYTGWSGRLDRRDHAVVRWAMDALAATPFAHRRVAELSDGERQRVVIARALAQEPAVLALDEPTAYVDVPRRVELTQTLRHLARECELAVLLTTHDLDLAVRVADRLWLIEPRATGPSVVHVGAPEDLVLSGALARAFRADDVHFDLARGTFVPDGHGVVSVRVVGRGVAATWAGRALEREGFALVGDQAAADAVVTVLDGPVWRLEVAGRADEHLTLGSLVRTADTAEREFWGAQFDHGLAWVQFPEGVKGGLGVSPRWQARSTAHRGGGRVDPQPLPQRPRHRHGRGHADRPRHRGAPATGWLRPMFTTEEIWCQLFSEPGAGSDLAALATTAVRRATPGSSTGRRCGPPSRTSPSGGCWSRAPTPTCPSTPADLLRGRHGGRRRRRPAAVPDHR